MLRVLTESGIEFQIDTAILVNDFFIFSVLENLTEKHSFADNGVLEYDVLYWFSQTYQKDF